MSCRDARHCSETDDGGTQSGGAHPDLRIIVELAQEALRLLVLQGHKWRTSCETSILTRTTQHLPAVPRLPTTCSGVVQRPDGHTEPAAHLADLCELEGDGAWAVLRLRRRLLGLQAKGKDSSLQMHQRDEVQSTTWSAAGLRGPHCMLANDTGLQTSKCCWINKGQQWHMQQMLYIQHANHFQTRADRNLISGNCVVVHLLDDALDGAVGLADRLAIGDDDALQRGRRSTSGEIDDR